MSEKVVKVVKGKGGWGGPFLLKETETLKIVASITGGGIHPVAQKIADYLGVQAVDGFSSKVEPSAMICAVIDCGGTARCGVYPKFGVKTVDIIATSPSGPLIKFMNEENFCSGVTVNDVAMEDGSTPVIVPFKAEPKSDAQKVEVKPEAKKEETKKVVEKKKEEAKKEMANNKQSGIANVISKIGRAVGGVVGVFYQAGRESIDIVIKNVLPFMAFISMMIGLIVVTGFGDVIAQAVKPLAGNIFGMVILSFIAAIPFLSPVLGPGAVIAQVVGVLLGVEIGKGTIPPSMALPALFAINAQVGCDFVPVGLTLGEAEAKTVTIGVPAVLFSRMITGPISVLIAWVASIGLYS
jgi:PTS system glucitol/sorbitol-specific IIC component